MERNPTLQWSPPSGAQWQEVELSTSSDFGTMVENPIVGGDYVYWVVETTLSYSTTYYWRIRACNAGGCTNSLTWSFTTVPAPPPAPVLSSPAEGATGVSISPTFSWNASSGATSYHFQLSTVSSFSSLVDNTSGIAGTSRSVTGLVPGTKYYWRVCARNSGGYGPWSAAWSFTLPPAAPILEFPLNGKTDVELNPTLQWTSPSGAALQEVELSTSSDFAVIVEYGYGDGNFEYHVVETTLSNGALYYWRVRACNAGGCTESVTRSFTTVPLPPAPALDLNPGEGAFNFPVTGTLTWTPPAGATSQYVQVSASSDFSSYLVNQSKNATAGSHTLSPALENGKLYYWRIRACNAGGCTNCCVARPMAA